VNDVDSRYSRYPLEEREKRKGEEKEGEGGKAFPPNSLITIPREKKGKGEKEENKSNKGLLARSRFLCKGKEGGGGEKRRGERTNEGKTKEPRGFFSQPLLGGGKGGGGKKGKGEEIRCRSVQNGHLALLEGGGKEKGEEETRKRWNS